MSAILNGVFPPERLCRPKLFPSRTGNEAQTGQRSSDIAEIRLTSCHGLQKDSAPPFHLARTKDWRPEVSFAMVAARNEAVLLKHFAHSSWDRCQAAGLGQAGDRSIMVTAAADHQALNDLYSLAYEELRRLARAVLRSDRAATVTPTTLVNEVWIKLARTPQVAQTSPLHFRRIAARAMRQLLVDAARRRHAQIHGGGLLRVSFCDSLDAPSVGSDLQDLLALDAALSALSKISPRQAQMVEGRFFGGLSSAELAEALECSEAAIMRDWRSARAWLACQMRQAATVAEV
jgi:RNA polymerase sigma factor (TIGR02999 family)